MNRTIAPNDLKSLLEKQTVTLLDVRRKADYEVSDAKLPGARWLDPEQLSEWSRSISKDRDVVLYCVRGGAVSNSVVDALRVLGVKARFIEGGIEAWKAAGGTTVAKSP